MAATQRELRAVRLFLDEHGVPPPSAARIPRRFGAGAIERLRDATPTRLTEVEGSGSPPPTRWPGRSATPADAPGRLERRESCTRCSEAETDGPLPPPARAELELRARRLLGGATSRDAIDALDGRGRLVDDGDRMPTPRMHAIERGSGGGTCASCWTPSPRRASSAWPSPTSRLRARPTTSGAAIEPALEHRLSILTGGPGTGKTATMSALVDLVRRAGPRVRLCAPTGKAARRAERVTGAEATTIHRLLEWIPGEGLHAATPTTRSRAPTC